MNVNDFNGRFDPMAYAGALSGQPAPFAPFGAGGQPARSQPGALSGFLDPAIALPIAAALAGGRNFQESLGGGLAAAGQGAQQIKAKRLEDTQKQAFNDWMKAGAPKDPNHPAMKALFDAAPGLAEKYVTAQFSPSSTDGMTSTIKTYDPQNGVTKIMGWNPQTHRYDIDAGMAPPASGTSIEYDPDGGGFRVLQGEGVTSGNKLPLGRSASSEEQKDIAPLEIQKKQVEHIADLYDPSFLTYAGKAETAKNRFLDKLGASGPNDRKQLGGATRFRQNVEQVFNAYRKDITGAAAALAELDRLKQSVINTDQSPAEFEAALGEFAQGLQRGLDIKKQLLDEGIALGSTKFSKEFEKRFLGGGGADGAGPGVESGAAQSSGGWMPYKTKSGHDVQIREKPGQSP